MNDTNDSDSSDEEQIEIPEQVVDPDNPWLAERKEFKDFMAGYNNFVQNNCEAKDINDQCKNNISDDTNSENKGINDQSENNKSNEKNNETKESKKNNVNKLKHDKIVTTKDKIKNKVKNITVHDLSTFDDEESDVEVLKIVTPKAKKVHFSDDTIKSETKVKEIDKNIKSKSKALCNKENSKIDVINTVAGTWYVSSDNINDNLNKKKVHRDVENAFKTVETELKNKINEKLLKLNKAKIKQPAKLNVKHQNEEVKSDYLKMNNKRIKAAFNEPLYEDNKTLDTNNTSNIEDNQESAIKIVVNPVNSKKQVQNIDPTEFLQVTQTNLETEEMTQVEDQIDDKEENEQEKLIAEAFADDDIINEFKY